MRLLMIDINGEHPNVMWRNFKNALSFEFDIKCYGPGFVSTTELEKGLHKFIEKNNGFDIIVVTSYLFRAAIGSETGNLRGTYGDFSYLLSQYNLAECIRFSASILHELDEIRDIAKIILVQGDVVTMPKALATAYRKKFDAGYYYLGWGFIHEYSKDREFRKNKLTNQHKNICQEYHNKIISLPICAINENNLCYTELAARPFDWIVPGNIKGYHQREIAQKILMEQGVKLWNEDKERSELTYNHLKLKNIMNIQFDTLYDRVVSIIMMIMRNPKHRYHIHMPLSPRAIGGYRENYLDALKITKYAYVDGGPGHVVVGKYMEVPAAGTVMIGETACGLRDMGFVPGVHMIEVSADGLKKMIPEIEHDIDHMQEIADNAKRLVVEKHTYRKRAEAFRRACEKIREGEFIGSHWENGDFILE